MCDIKCVICGEPWDAYGINHGDMLPWEARLFRQGAGCPCCEGRNDKQWEPQILSDIENGDQDPMVRLIAWENAKEGRAPKWERPEPKVLWTCEGCGVQVMRDPDDSELEYVLPVGAKARQWCNSHNFACGEPTEEPAHVFDVKGKNPRPVCEFCLQHCEHCHEPICGTLEYGDIYDDGVSFPIDGCGRECVCINCYEKRCEDCGGYYDDGSCTCREDEYQDSVDRAMDMVKDAKCEKEWLAKYGEKS